jgi:hypothetical protein
MNEILLKKTDSEIAEALIRMVENDASLYADQSRLIREAARRLNDRKQEDDGK